MEPLATLEQLEARIHTTVDADQAMIALKGASGLVRGLTKQTFTFVSQETVDLRGGGEILTLPQRPLVVDGSNLLTVVELGDFGGINYTAIEGRDYTRLGNELTRGYSWWYNSRLQGWPRRQPLGVWAPRVRVTYSHGYKPDVDGNPTIPDEIVKLVLDIAEDAYDNPTRLRSFTTPEYSETRAAEALGETTVAGIKATLNSLGYRRGAFSI